MKHKRRGSGFTLLEMVIAMAVMTIGILGLLLTNVNIQQVSDVAYERIVAIQDTHRVLELIRNTSATGNFPGNVTAAFPNGQGVTGFNNLDGEQVVVTYTDANANPLDIVVTTNWREGGRRNAAVQLRTLMTQRG